MATAGETLGELYARIGLQVDDLEKNFVQVDRTLRDNMARLNRQRNLIDLQARVELAGLDEAADATQIFQIRQRALQQQIQTQQAKLRILSNVLNDARNRTGELSDETQRAQVQYEQARLALRRLETQIENLNETQEDAAESTADWGERIKNVIETGRFIGAVENIAGVIEGISELTTRTIEEFKELEQQAYELNMTFNDTENFLRHMRLAGGDIGDFEGYIRGITDAYVKGEWDDPEFIALRKYGAEITDATGKLKNFQEITEEVYQAYLKAKAAGEEIEFLQLTGGESGVRDAIQYFERYAEAKEDAAKIFDAGVDPEEMHKAERSVALLSEQFDELTDAVLTLFSPATTEAADRFFKIFHDSTKFIQENSAAIRSATSASFNAFTSIPLINPVRNIFDSLTKPDEKTVETINDQVEQSAKIFETAKKVVDRALSGDDSQLSQYGIQRVNQFKEELEDLRLELDYENEFERKIAELDLWKQRELDNKNYVSNDERLAIEELYAAKLEQIEQEKAEQIAEITSEYEDLRTAAVERESEKRIAQYEDEQAALLENADADEIIGIVENQQKKISAVFEEQLQRRIDAIENEFEQRKEIATDDEIVELEKLRQQKISDIQEEFAEKRDAIFKDSEERTKKFLQEAADIEFNITHDSYEQQMRVIEQWKDAQLEKARTAEEVAAIIADQAAKEAEAFEKEVDRIRGKIETLQDKIFAQEHSQLEVELRKLNKEREELYNEGIYPTDLIERYYSNALQELQRKAQESLSRNAKDSGGWGGGIDFRNNTATQEFSAYQQAIDIATQKYSVSAENIIAARQRETNAIIEQSRAIERGYTVIGWGNQAISDFGNNISSFADNAKKGYDIIQWGAQGAGNFGGGNNAGNSTKTSTFDKADYLNKMPAQIEKIRQAILEGGIEKLGGGSYAAKTGYNADLMQFSAVAQQAGYSPQEYTKILDDIYNEVEQIATATPQERYEQSLKEAFHQAIEQKNLETAELFSRVNNDNPIDRNFDSPTNDTDNFNADFERFSGAIDNLAQQLNQQSTQLASQFLAANQADTKSYAQPAQNVNNQITVQIDNVNADELERVQEAADLIAQKVTAAVQSANTGTNLSYAS